MPPLFVASSPFHIEILEALRARGSELGIVAVCDERVSGAAFSGTVASPNVFALRGLARVLRARDRALRARQVLESTHASCVVVGNDVAPLERAMIGAARLAGLPSVLLQDGLFPAWDSDHPRAFIARLAVAGGLRDLAPTVYGSGQTDYIGALGPAWLPAYRTLRAPRSVRALAVGNAAFAAIQRTVATRSAAEWKKSLRLDDRPLCVFFTTNELRGHGVLRPERHARQLAEIAASRDAVDRAGFRFLLRLHPAEGPSDYGSLAALAEPLSSAPLAAVIGSSDLGLVTVSAVALLLSLSGRRVIRSALTGVDDDSARAVLWLRIPLARDDESLARAPLVDREWLAQLVTDDDDQGGSRSVRFIEAALR